MSHGIAYSNLALVREGDLVAGKYRVERILGGGGMGIVVAARHVQLGQLVAVKYLRPEAMGHADAIERFLREARAAACLKSDHAAHILDVGTLDSGAPYMVMEFLEGTDLGRLLIEQGPLPIERAVLLMRQACRAVAEAHAAGIIHRDLKPQNLFLTQTSQGEPRLKVLDFGVSKAMSLSSDGVGSLTHTRVMLGSPLYMAPEQMRSARDVDQRADVWALGVVLFELLTRRWPFEADSMPELCLKVVTDPPQSLRALRPDASPLLDQIVARCLEKEPAQRFPSALALAAALDAFVANPHGSLPPLELPMTSLAAHSSPITATITTSKLSARAAWSVLLGIAMFGALLFGLLLRWGLRQRSAAAAGDGSPSAEVSALSATTAAEAVADPDHVARVLAPSFSAPVPITDNEPSTPTAAAPHDTLAEARRATAISPPLVRAQPATEPPAAAPVPTHAKSEESLEIRRSR